MPSFIARFIEYPLPVLFGIFLCLLLGNGVLWYQDLSAPSAEQTAYIGGLVVAVVGFIKYYCEMLKK